MELVISGLNIRDKSDKVTVIDDSKLSKIDTDLSDFDVILQITNNLPSGYWKINFQLLEKPTP